MSLRALTSLLCVVLMLMAATASSSAQNLRWSPGTLDAHDRALLDRWHERQVEIRALQKKFTGSIEVQGFNLLDLGAVGFVLEQSRDFPRRFLDPDDHEFVFNAVEGQSGPELEANLPAIVNYIRLTMSVRAFLPAARVRKPLLGRRKGMDTLLEIARGVYDFRSQQLNKVHSGELPPAHVLTKANLGTFGDRATLSRLEQAYHEGHRQFTSQRNLVVLGVVAIQLQFGLLVALWIRKKGDRIVVLRGRV